MWLDQLMEVTNCRRCEQKGHGPREGPSPPVDKSKRPGPKEKRMLNDYAFTGFAGGGPRPP
eukprot:6351771-Pyramimonas_sp.AAC.1